MTSSFKIGGEALNTPFFSILISLFLISNMTAILVFVFCFI
jgi:hypothetical protein